MLDLSSNNAQPLGYRYHEPHPAQPTAHYRLEVHILATPTEQHFDVRRAQFGVRTAAGTLGELTVTQPWSYEPRAWVCPGVVVLTDRKGKKEEAFTFGGDLTIRSQDAQTTCELVSPVPILGLSGAPVVPCSFIEELEILLAQQRARFSVRQTYEKQLCQLDPVRLYQACLQDLRQKLSDFQYKDVRCQQLLAHLQAQVQRLVAVGLWETPPPTLGSIFV